MQDDPDGVYKEMVEKILLDPKNVSTPKELYQQANACLSALKSSDTNQDGIISNDEIGKLCELMGLPVTGAEDTEDSALDLDDDGTLTHEEYMEWWLRRISRQPGLANQQRVLAKNTFGKFDVDGSGAIDCNEFSKLVVSLGVEFSEDECEQAIKELDTDGSGEIEVNEFVEWWVNRTKGVRKGGGLIAFKLKKLANKAAQMFYTDIHKATWDGDMNLVKLFLDTDESMKNAPDTTEYGNDWRPLHYACYQGHADIVNELIERGASVNTKNGHDFTPLFYAAQQNYPEICLALLDSGADPSICGIVCDERSFKTEADAMEDMYYGIPPLCPADFVSSDLVHSNEGLRDVFATHEKFTLPLQSEIKDAALSNVGEFSFQVCDIEDISKLPIRKWRIIVYDMSDEVCTEYTAAHAHRMDTVTHTPPEDNLIDIITAAKDGGILSVEVMAINACGEGERSYKADINMSSIF